MYPFQPILMKNDEAETRNEVAAAAPDGPRSFSYGDVRTFEDEEKKHLSFTEA